MNLGNNKREIRLILKYTFLKSERATKSWEN